MWIRVTVFLSVCGSFGIVHVNPWAEQSKEQAKNRIKKKTNVFAGGERRCVAVRPRQKAY